MSNEVNLGESPNHFIVLDAISRGINNIGKISSMSKLSKTEVELIVNDLVFQRLVANIEKRGFFGRKKIELKITETGANLLGDKKRELGKKVQELHQYYNNGDRSQMDSFMVSNRAWMPMMLFTGIMDILFFTSMMSLMGLALNPMESSFTGSSGNLDNSDSADNTSADSADNTDNSNTDSQDVGNDGGGFDGGGFDGGGFDGGGFDGGGFDGGGFDF